MTDDRLDMLLYGHDGRGLGHVSRSVAVGMAVRRLYPNLKVCLLTGCRRTGELIGSADLDWIKLPAYDTEVVDGRSTGVDGPAGFTDRDLGRFRAEQIRQVVALYRPRLVLVDHTPQGKHRELVEALQDHRPDKTRWVLGMRGVVGSVAQTRSDTAVELFKAWYEGLLWYGDSSVLGSGHMARLASLYGTEAVECGYVSRLAEQGEIVQPAGYRRFGCTVSIPWFSRDTAVFFKKLVEAVSMAGPGFGRFRFFLGGDQYQAMSQQLQGLDFCSAEPFGDQYVEALYGSRSAVIFGGYNSLVDILSIGIPALVVRRGMADNEQHEHVDALLASMKSRLIGVDESDCSVESLYRGLQSILEITPDPFETPVNIGGAGAAARHLFTML